MTGTILQNLFLSVKVRIIWMILALIELPKFTFFIYFSLFSFPLYKSFVQIDLTAYLSYNDCFFSAQRQIGETALNEASSRSHQILRLVYMFLFLSQGCEILQCIIGYNSYILWFFRQLKVPHVNFWEMTNQALLLPLWYDRFSQITGKYTRGTLLC